MILYRKYDADKNIDMIWYKASNIIYSECLECGGTGIFDCGIPEMKRECVQCKGIGIQYFGTI